MRTPSILISLLLALACAAPAAAGSEFKKTLVIRGRTLDADGSPLGKTRVVADGARRASTTSDGQGEFALVVPLGTTDDLRRGPLRFAVVAERRGWHFTTARGHSRLAVEIELEVGGDGMGRCIARSNDERLAASAAKVIALDGEAAGSVEVDFRGSRGSGPEGDQAGSPLEHVAKTTLWIEEGSDAGARPAEAETGDVASRPARKKRTPSPSEIERTLAEIRARATRDSLAAVAREAARAAKAQQRATRTKDRGPRREAPAPRNQSPAPTRSASPRSASPRSASPPAAPAETLAAGPQALPRLQGPTPDRAADDSLIAQWRDAQWRRSGSAPESEPVRAPVRKRGGKPAREPEEAGASREAGTDARPRDEAAANAPSPDDESIAVPPGRGEARVVDPEPAGHPAEPMAPGRAPVEPAAGSGKQPAPSPEPAASRRPQITPEPTSRQSRGRSRPLVVRAERGETGRAASDTCRCRIEGTVEVQSEVALKSPERVEVWLHWYPQLCDTLELFMGAPRQFVFPAAPCGPQRVRLRVLTEGEFDVVSREAMSGFRCESGAIVQRRVVLVPRRPPAAVPFLRPAGEPPPSR